MDTIYQKILTNAASNGIEPAIKYYIKKYSRQWDGVYPYILEASIYDNIDISLAIPPTAAPVNMKLWPQFQRDVNDYIAGINVNFEKNIDNYATTLRIGAITGGTGYVPNKLKIFKYYDNVWKYRDTIKITQAINTVYTKIKRIKKVAKDEYDQRTTTQYYPFLKINFDDEWKEFNTYISKMQATNTKPIVRTIVAFIANSSTKTGLLYDLNNNIIKPMKIYQNIFYNCHQHIKNITTGGLAGFMATPTYLKNQSDLKIDVPVKGSLTKATVKKNYTTVINYVKPITVNNTFFSNPALFSSPITSADIYFHINKMAKNLRNFASPPHATTLLNELYNSINDLLDHRSKNIVAVRNLVVSGTAIPLPGTFQIGGKSQKEIDEYYRQKYLKYKSKYFNLK